MWTPLLSQLTALSSNTNVSVVFSMSVLEPSSIADDGILVFWRLFLLNPTNIYTCSCSSPIIIVKLLTNANCAA